MTDSNRHTISKHVLPFGTTVEGNRVLLDVELLWLGYPRYRRQTVEHGYADRCVQLEIIANITNPETGVWVDRIRRPHLVGSLLDDIKLDIPVKQARRVFELWATWIDNDRRPGCVHVELEGDECQHTGQAYGSCHYVESLPDEVKAEILGWFGQ